MSWLTIAGLCICIPEWTVFLFPLVWRKSSLSLNGGKYKRNQVKRVKKGLVVCKQEGNRKEIVWNESVKSFEKSISWQPSSVRRGWSSPRSSQACRVLMSDSDDSGSGVVPQSLPSTQATSLTVCIGRHSGMEYARNISGLRKLFPHYSHLEKHWIMFRIT